MSTPRGLPVAHAFPAPERIAELSERVLRDCRMGFRAPYLLEAARQVAHRTLDLDTLPSLPLDTARARLMSLPGVGRKIADCVLLFASGFTSAFPVDVWILRALRAAYFPRRRISTPRLIEFAASHFGPYGGYAQQYLFHDIRTRPRRSRAATHPQPVL